MYVARQQTSLPLEPSYSYRYGLHFWVETPLAGGVELLKSEEQPVIIFLIVFDGHVCSTALVGLSIAHANAGQVARTNAFAVSIMFGVR